MDWQKRLPDPDDVCGSFHVALSDVATGCHRARMSVYVWRQELDPGFPLAVLEYVVRGDRDPLHWQRVAKGLIEVAGGLPDVRVLDLGGGLGVPEKEGDAPLDLAALDRSLTEIRAALPGCQLWLEPGRYLVSEAGVLLAKVTQTKTKSGARFVGIATGMNSLIRPALYGAYHGIVHLSRLEGPPAGLVTVVGPICETGDRLGRDRLLPETREGDVMLIANAGAYGYAMSSRYNLREPAEEIML